LMRIWLFQSIPFRPYKECAPCWNSWTFWPVRNQEWKFNDSVSCSQQQSCQAWCLCGWFFFGECTPLSWASELHTSRWFLARTFACTFGKDSPKKDPTGPLSWCSFPAGFHRTLPEEWPEL
jgi:hypothetical protein